MDERVLDYLVKLEVFRGNSPFGGATLRCKVLG